MNVPLGLYTNMYDPLGLYTCIQCRVRSPQSACPSHTPSRKCPFNVNCLFAVFGVWLVLWFAILASKWLYRSMCPPLIPARPSESTRFTAPVYPLIGDGGTVHPKGVLPSYGCPTVGTMSLLAAQGIRICRAVFIVPNPALLPTSGRSHAAYNAHNPHHQQISHLYHAPLACYTK